MCRAFASLVDIATGVSHLVREEGAVFAMKSKHELLDQQVGQIGLNKCIVWKSPESMRLDTWLC